MFNRWLLTIWFVATPVALTAASQPAIKAFNQGVDLLKAKKCREAIPYFDEAVSRDPDFAYAYYARAICKREFKSWDSAILDLGDAIRKDPSLLEARTLRASVNADADRFDRALEDFSYVLDRKPDDADALFGRGLIYLQRENRTSAEGDFKRLLRVSPTHPAAKDIRKLLASLSGESAEPSDEGSAHAPASPGGYAPARTRAAPVNVQALIRRLQSRSGRLSEEYGRKVLRGEKGAQAVGEIQ